jgi:hypothetical protein
MNTIQRVQELAAERGMSIYKLSQLSAVSYSTIRTAQKRNGELTVDVIERISAALGISVAEFFSVFK